MARVAVVHNTLDFQGGADAVCLATCEALLTDHEVELFTLSETDPSDLADRFDADVSGLAVRTPPANSPIARALARLAPVAGPQLAFRSVLVGRYFGRHADRFDIAVSTANEMRLAIPSVQYIHYPQFHHRALEATDGGRLNPLWSRLAGPDRETTGGATLLVNSAWTGDVVERIYGVRPTVLHPPVDPIDGGLDWDQREQGIVVVGRIAPDKRVLDAMTVVDRLRDRGHTVHLHVVGSAPQSYRPYVDRVVSEADRRAYVTLERDVTRDRLETLLRTHRYGLNLKRDEHFGMSVAEYVAAGMIAFAPDGGGQRDILKERTDRLFDSLSGAVDCLETSLETDDRPTLPRDRFSRRRFKSAIERHVNQALGR
ncbi:glycosyltransferase [Halapricum desulfuricans]|uniref:Glycosyltransferase n=1 Tax=Halapricum desulfuricans TaxID=2841257 RepID=A0A897N0J4_9EURY|nr:glycosyltransferase [Halapricum desulfuricans]QSG04649.1 Glycosyltransferase [Halapricum desulfuricans]